MTRTPGKPQIVAHRGASGVAHENSPAAFRAAGDAGVDAVELDVHATRDGGFLVHHDPALPDLGPIAALDRAALAGAKLPNGEAIPWLEDAFAWMPGLTLWIEVKALPARWDQALLSTLASGPSPGRYAVHSFDHRIIARLGEAAPGLRRGILSGSYPLDPVRQFDGTGATVLWQEWTLVDQALVREVHGRGCEIIAWTVNRTDAAHRLAGWGVDGLCGNFPERLRMEPGFRVRS